MRVQFIQPAITEEDIAEVTRVLRSGWLVLQKETALFEQAFAEYLGVKEAVLVNSCTCALHLSLVLAGIKEGDEVITTPLSYVSTVSPILHCGARPVFVDVEETTGLLNPDLVEAAITPKTKAILPVHLYGQLADMRRLRKIADAHNLVVIEDAAHAIESQRDGVRSGQRGFSASFSFHVAKNITAGTGGALAMNDPVLADRARILRRDGVRNVGNLRRMEALGFKYLATDYQAALLRNQLKRIDAQRAHRQKLYEGYAKVLDELGVAYNRVAPDSVHAFHMMVMWVDPKKRDHLRDELLRAEIETSIHYNPIHLEPFYREHFAIPEGTFPVAERLGYSTITLPLNAKMTEEELRYVTEHLRRLLGR